MSKTPRTAVVALLVLGLLAGVMTATAGAHTTDVTEAPVSTVGHICDQWGLENDWGDHERGDGWEEHPHHVDHAPDGHHGPLGHHDSTDHRDSAGHHGPDGSHGDAHHGR